MKRAPFFKMKTLQSLKMDIKMEKLMWSFVTFTLILPSIICAPSTYQSNYYYNLYSLHLKENCSLPKVVDGNEYVKVKVNLACAVNTSSAQISAKLPSSKVCQSLSDLFPKLCKISGNMPSVAPSVNTSVDLKKGNSLGLENFCGRIQEVFHNISQVDGLEKWSVSPFDKEQSCESECKNVQLASISKDDTFQVSPECILLFEGYNIYQQYQVLRKNSVKPAVSPQPAPVDANMEMPVSETVKELESSKEIQSLEQINQSPASHNREGVLLNKKSSVVLNVNNSTVGNPKTNGTIASAVKPPSKTAENAVQSSLKKTESQSSKIPLQSKTVLVSGSSSTTSTTTPVSININDANQLGDDGLMPLPDVKKVKSSTSMPGNQEKKPEIDKLKQGMDLPALKPGNDGIEQQKNGKGSSSTKNNAADAEFESEEYGTEDIEVGPNTKNENTAKDTDMEVPPLAKNNLDLDRESIYNKGSSNTKAQNRFSGNGFEDQPFENRGTTINVSLNENEDTGFFSYFLFGVTLSGLVYLIFHNKKKLIAYVVEGKRPRSRGRRPSGSSQYRRLENNFD